MWLYKQHKLPGRNGLTLWAQHDLAIADVVSSTVTPIVRPPLT